MKLFRYTLGLLGAAAMFCGCEELEKVEAYAPDSDQIVSPVLAKLPAEIVMTGENLKTELTFKWDAADFGIATQVNYSVEVAKKDASDKVVLFSGIAETSYTTTYQTLNTALLREVEKGGIGLLPDEASDVNFYVSATLGSTYPAYYSNAIPVKVTCTASDPVYPAVFVIGDYNSWTHDNDLRLFDFAETDVNYSGMIDFMWKAQNGFKITGIQGWDDSCNWGTDGDAEAPADEAASIQLISSGGSGNISAFHKRFYQLSFNKSTLVLTNKRSFDYIGVIGDFNGWGGDLLMYYDNATQKFFADIEIPSESGLKFRIDKDWAVSFGTSDKESVQTKGVLDGGENIKVPAGNYRIYVNMNNPDEMTFELKADDYKITDPGEHPVKPEEPTEDIWGVIGVNGWEAGDDIVTVAEGDWFVAKNVALTTSSEFKFRLNGGWAANRGAESTDPVQINTAYVAKNGGENIKVAADGTYDIYLSADLNTFCIMEAGKAPVSL